ncbi:MAG: DedA family protein [Acidobacteriota bacterium]|nr:DedA family protein [Acidobacteriota bacterium]
MPLAKPGGMFDWVTGVIGQLGYWGIAALTFLENIVPPIPSELVIPLAGFVAAQGTLNIWLVIVAAVTGSLAGALAWYGVARSIGAKRLRAWIAKHGQWVTLTSEDIDRAQAWFDKHSAWAVMAGRIVPGVRTFISVPAGFANMPLAPFLLYSAAGTLVWTAALAYGGKLLQAGFGLIGDYVNIASNIILVAFVALLAYCYVRVFRRRATSARGR